MAKHLLDKYYTPVEDAKRLIDITLRVLQEHNYEISEVIEPSAGNGSFSHQIECTAYDIEPEADDIIKADFLTLPLEYKKGRLFIGNPPFGERNNLSIKFYKKCCVAGDYIAFVQPISQYQENWQMYEFELIYSEDLGHLMWSGRDRHCCFNIYVRPSGGKLNSKPNEKLKDITIVDLRRGNKERYDYIMNHAPDYGICSYGGSSGKKTDYVGQYVRETYFYCNKPEYKDKMIELLQRDKLLAALRTISKKSVCSISKLYKYLKDNIEGIE